MFCPNCGKRIEENTCFCSGCGVKIEERTRSSVPHMMKKTSDTVNNGIQIMWGAFAVAATLFIGMSGFFPIVSVPGEQCRAFDLVEELWGTYRRLQKYYTSWSGHVYIEEMRYILIGLAGLLLALIFYVTSVIYSLITVGKLITGKETDNVASAMVRSTGWGLAYLLLPGFMGMVVDVYIKQIAFYPSVWCVIAIMIATFNILVFIRGYQGKLTF